MTLSQPSKAIRVYYKITEMLKPELLYAKSPNYPGKVAWTVAFVPTFERTTKAKTRMEIVEDSEP